MSSVIGLLMLAITLLQAVRDNPTLPQPFKDQATTIALQAIAEANNYIASSTVPATIPVSMPQAENTQPASAPVGTSAPTPTSIEVYSLQYEQSLVDVYYAGDKELASAKINDNDAAIATSKYLPDDCINISKDGVFIKKVCGYWMARISGIAVATDTVSLVAKDGSTFTGSAK